VRPHALAHGVVEDGVRLPGATILNVGGVTDIMAVFFWKDQLSVGNTFIDSDHRHLIGLLNDVYDAMYASRGPDILGAVLNDLILYTQEHFKREEDIMQAINYAELSAHKAEHDKLTGEVLEMQSRFLAGETKIMVDLLKFLFDWLFEHIVKIDKKLAQAIRDAESDPSLPQ
jgi:hemerythrin-like metal-binding protein